MKVYKKGKELYLIGYNLNTQYFLHANKDYNYKYVGDVKISKTLQRSIKIGRYKLNELFEYQKQKIDSLVKEIVKREEIVSEIRKINNTFNSKIGEDNK